MDFRCDPCNLTIHDAKPLGTSPDGVVGNADGRTGLTGHVAAEHHYALTIPEGIGFAGIADFCGVEAIIDGPINGGAVDWLRYFIQRDMIREGDAS